MPNELDLAYIAGLFDGEGTIMIGKLKPRPDVYGGRQNFAYTLRFQITQSIPTVLYWAKDVIGIGNVCVPLGLGCPVYQAGGKTAYEIIKILQPYIRIKKLQAELAIHFQESLVRWRVTPPHEVARRDLYYRAMRCLNQSMGSIEQLGELLEYPIDSVEDNQQPSHSKVVEIVEWKVQRLTAEDVPTNNADTSAQHESDDIVRACR